MFTLKTADRGVGLGTENAIRGQAKAHSIEPILKLLYFWPQLWGGVTFTVM